MPFVRKPKPYTTHFLGRLSSVLAWPSWRRSARPKHKTAGRSRAVRRLRKQPAQRQAARRQPAQPLGQRWVNTRLVNTLAGLGLLTLLLIGGSAVYNQFNRNTQFTVMQSRLAATLNPDDSGLNTTGAVVP